MASVFLAGKEKDGQTKTNKQTDRQTDRAKTVYPDLSMQGHKSLLFWKSLKFVVWERIDM